MYAMEIPSLPDYHSYQMTYQDPEFRDQFSATCLSGDHETVTRSVAPLARLAETSHCSVRRSELAVMLLLLLLMVMLMMMMMMLF